MQLEERSALFFFLFFGLGRRIRRPRLSGPRPGPAGDLSILPLGGCFPCPLTLSSSLDWVLSLSGWSCQSTRGQKNVSAAGTSGI
mmetsp:Transcript_48145/g.109151  ORF Transcript_48145/g.109151 Transcript_48145/m.109151 type:complete len:85 (-) Transcript_48145:1392-1646(-)